MAVQAVIFDIGGVLEHTPPTGWQQRWARELGLDPAEFERRLDPIWRQGSIGAIPLERAERLAAQAIGIDDRALAAFMADLWVEYLGTLNVELAEFCGGLRPRYRTGIISNSFVGAREREESAYGFGGLCDTIVYSHEVGVLKPDPRIYVIGCERLGVHPRDAVFVDDVEACVSGARAIGMTAITFVETRQVIEELRTILSTKTLERARNRPRPAAI